MSANARGEPRIEVWMRGPVPDVSALLQPVAHSLMECREEVDTKLVGVTRDILWTEQHGAASAGFHVRHAAGALDRLFSYARGEQLTPEQFAFLSVERDPDWSPDSAERLIQLFDARIERALEQVRATDEHSLMQPRVVGRAGRPSTVIGLLFHAAEHTQRHMGQFATTLKVVTRMSSAESA